MALRKNYSYVRVSVHPGPAAGLHELRKALEQSGVRVPSVFGLESLARAQNVGYATVDSFVMDVPLDWVPPAVRARIAEATRAIPQSTQRYSMPPPWRGEGPPPLGTALDIEAIEAAEWKEVAELPYIDALDVPLVHRAVIASLPTIQAHQRRHGVEALQLRPHLIRLISPTVWRTNAKLNEGLGFWDHRGRIAYLKYSPGSSERSRSYALWSAYAVVHELCHGAQKGVGIQDFSFHLNEGCTDRMAKEAFEAALAKTLSFFEKRRQAERRQKGCELQGVAVDPDYLFGNGLGYSRVIEIEILRELERRDPLCGSHLLNCAFHAEGQKAEQIVARIVSHRELGLLKDRDVAPVEVLKALRTRT